MPNTFEGRVLVTGAGGKLGRSIVEQLLASGAKNVVAASRDTAKLTDLGDRGAELQRVDFDDPASLKSAFTGVARVLLISTDAIAVPGQRKQQHKNAIDAAVTAGVRHILYTSMPDPEHSLMPFASDHLESEAEIKANGLPYTILRVNWYMENLMMWLPQALQSAQWFTSSGGGRTGQVAREDVAAVAAAMLRAPSLQSETLDITGAKSLNATDIAAAVQQALGKELAVIPVNDEQLAEGLAKAGVPAPLAGIIVALDANTRAGSVDIVSDAVQLWTGRPPQTLTDFLRARKEALLAGA